MRGAPTSTPGPVPSAQQQSHSQLGLGDLSTPRKNPWNVDKGQAMVTLQDTSTKGKSSGKTTKYWGLRGRVARQGLHSLSFLHYYHESL